MSRTEDPCPGCGGVGRSLVWSAGGVPVRACTAKGASPAAALAFPRGDVRLLLCPACGLLHNAAFDPALLEAAGEGPSDTTAHIPGHAERTRALAERIVERWSIRRGRVVEVGCGEGHLLAALCRAGGNVGIGVDPAAPPRAPDPRVELVRQPYSTRHLDIPADLVLSRYLLEHVAAPRLLVERVAEQARRSRPRGRRPALALLEVPDGRATLVAATFWEVYYEHVSYFTAASLARLARRAGLEPLDVSTRGRSLTLVGRAAGAEAAPAPDDAAELDELRAVAASFTARARPRLERLRADLEAARGRRRVALWGAGARTAAFLAAVGPRAAAAVECVVDVDPAKQGARLAGTGQPVLAPAELGARGPDVVLVMNDLYVDDVRRGLAGLTRAPEVLAA